MPRTKTHDPRLATARLLSDAGTHKVGPACSPVVTNPAALNRSHPPYISRYCERNSTGAFFLIAAENAGQPPVRPLAGSDDATLPICLLGLDCQ